MRTWEASDATSLARHANCREIWRGLRDRFPHPYSIEDAAQFIDSCREADPQTHFVIEVHGQAAGSIGLSLGADVERISAEVGYWLGREFWGKGIMTEALIAFRDYALTQFSLTRVHARTYEWNQASARVLEKAGFELEGRLRRSAIKDGQILDQHLYAYVCWDTPRSS